MEGNSPELKFEALDLGGCAMRVEHQSWVTPVTGSELRELDFL